MLLVETLDGAAFVIDGHQWNCAGADREEAYELNDVLARTDIGFVEDDTADAIGCKVRRQQQCRGGSGRASLEAEYQHLGDVRGQRV